MGIEGCHPLRPRIRCRLHQLRTVKSRPRLQRLHEIAAVQTLFIGRVGQHCDAFARPQRRLTVGKRVGDHDVRQLVPQSRNRPAGIEQQIDPPPAGLAGPEVDLAGTKRLFAPAADRRTIGFAAGVNDDGAARIPIGGRLAAEPLPVQVPPPRFAALRQVAGVAPGGMALDVEARRVEHSRERPGFGVEAILRAAARRDGTGRQEEDERE